jgi:lysozyme
MPSQRSVRRALIAVSLVLVGLVVPALHAPPAAAHTVTVSPSFIPPGPVATWPIGVDVASHQHPFDMGIDWWQVRAAGVSFAFVKADEGPVSAGRYVNPWFHRDTSEARAAGLLTGAYHYARPRWPLSSAESDARAFVRTVGPTLGGAALSPALDLEETGGLGPSALADWAGRWVRTVEALTGYRPMVYTGLFFWADQVASTPELSEYPLWFARYGDAPGLLPGGWWTWSFWQFTKQGRVPGIIGDVDLNLSCGRPTELVNECGGTRYVDWIAWIFAGAV